MYFNFDPNMIAFSLVINWVEGHVIHFHHQHFFIDFSFNFILQLERTFFRHEFSIHTIENQEVIVPKIWIYDYIHDWFIVIHNTHTPLCNYLFHLDMSSSQWHMWLLWCDKPTFKSKGILQQLPKNGYQIGAIQKKV